MTHPAPQALDAAIKAALVDARVDVICLAGYLKKLGPDTLAAFRGRVLNTHPALLPKFGGTGMFGDRVFEAVLASGDSESGVSLHVVDEHYDTGSVVQQARVHVEAGDSVIAVFREVDLPAVHGILLEHLFGRWLTLADFGP